MADNKYRYPPAPPNGDDTFSRNLVGMQITDGGGLTQGNFEFTESIGEKKNRNFDIGSFSEPITLSDLKIKDIEQAKLIASKNFSVYPNYDLTRVTNFALYGSLQKRLSSSINKIINYFPASIDVDYVNIDYTTGYTAYDITFDLKDNSTEFKISVAKIKNPFDIDFTKNSFRNVSVSPIESAEIRDLTTNYLKYSLYMNGEFNNEFPVLDFTPSENFTSGYVTVVVSGNPFNNQSTSITSFNIKPNNLETEMEFTNNFDEVERFILNRSSVPQYTCKFQVVEQDISGKFFKTNKSVTWPLNGKWNLDIITEKYNTYIQKLSDIGRDLDDFKTDLISRFLTTGAFKDFDTDDQKMEKVLQLYGRGFDEIKKFIDALGHINSVNYVVKDDIPSQLLKNLSMTLGWSDNISPISNDNFLESVFNTKEGSIYGGKSKDDTPAEINFQFYRNLILNSANLFKSKGTKKSIEYIFRLIGAPKALIEINETIYLADGPINMDLFNSEFNLFSGGTKIQTETVLNPSNTYTIGGVPFTGFTTQSVVLNVDTTRDDYPIDELGYPSFKKQNENFFYQQGAGWYEQTSEHRSLEVLNTTGSVFTGMNPTVQTTLEPFTYGAKYLRNFTNFPYMDLGFSLTRVIDNRKSWSDSELGLRNEKTNIYSSYYQVSDDRLVLNSKNVEAFLNIGQGMVYDIWDMSKKYNYPIPSSGLTGDFQNTEGIDRTIISPKPKEKTFFEFAQTFYRNMINVRTRQSAEYNYPSLQKLYWNYINSEETVNIPSNKYNYQKMIDFTNGIGDYWMKLVEQVIPATTLWSGGQKFENNVFNRQKVVWRKQRGCEIVPIVQNPCTLSGPIFLYDCITREAVCNITMNNQYEILNLVLNNVVDNNGYDINNCSLSSIVSVWSVNILFGNILIADEEFFTGNGSNSVPTSDQWYQAVESSMANVLPYGLVYTIQDNIVKVQNSGCETLILQPTFNINVKVDLTINCLDNSLGMLSFIDGEPLFSTKEQAINFAESHGLDGYRTYGYNGQLAFFAGKSKDEGKVLNITKNPFIINSN